MNPHYYSQTESSSQKAMPPIKLKEKLESLTEDIEHLKDEMENQSRAVQTIEKHNTLILRQFDQLRGIFENFYEEIVDKLGKTEKNFEDKLTQIEINTLPKIMKLEKLAELNKMFRDQTNESLNEIKQLNIKVDKLANENSRLQIDLKENSGRIEDLRKGFEQNWKSSKVLNEEFTMGVDKRLNDLEKGFRGKFQSADDGLKFVSGEFEKFKEQMNNDFFIMTNWAAQVDKKLVSIPSEFTKHLDKMFDGIEQDFHRRAQDQKDAMALTFQELSRKIDRAGSQKNMGNFSNFY